MKILSDDTFSLNKEAIYLDSHTNNDLNIGNANDTTMRKDDETKMKVLFDSLDVIVGLAKMDSEKWRQTLLDVQTSRERTSLDRDNAAALQKRFDSLQSQWKFEERSIPQLFQSIHQFHSKSIHLTAHSDYVSEENKFIREQLTKAQKRMSKLEATVKKLHEKNMILMEEVESMTSERKCLLNGVCNNALDSFEARISLNCEQFEYHERFMKQIGNARDNKGRSSPTNETASITSQSLEDVHNPAVDDSSLSSTESISCINNNGVATVRIDQIPKTEPRTPTDMSKKYGWFSSIVSNKDYFTLHYPANSKVGMQFHPMELTAAKREKRSLPLPKFITRKKLLIEKSDSKREKQQAFFVCGHHGFEYSVNPTAPPIGSYLAAVNGKEVGTASLSEIYITLQQGLPFTLSFKVGPLTSTEEASIAQAVKVAKRKYIN
mmetsp:Transcript_1342/g.1757  ORF Transcript_1342/g.1757 Transcript_1342/m.1757 type:complete len:435 (-) Transcript_1342:149-1453(-)